MVTGSKGGIVRNRGVAHSGGYSPEAGATAKLEVFGMQTTLQHSSSVPSDHIGPKREPLLRTERLAAPVTGVVAVAYAMSLGIAVMMAAVSAMGLLLGRGGLYGDPTRAASVQASTAGLLVPGFLGHDLFNFLIGVPLLLAILWLTRRGSLAGLLLWPGVLFYVLYTYATYLLGAPFGPLFLAHVALVAASAYMVIAVIVTMDVPKVRDRLAPVVPARVTGGLLVALGMLTLVQDGSGAVTTSLAGISVAEPAGRHIWAADLAIEVPALLVGGVLLWRRTALGYVAAAGLLLQFGLTPLALAAMLALQPLVTGAPADVGTITGVLLFALVCCVALAYVLLRIDRIAPSLVARNGVSHA
jgi:hypothetical protein